MYVDPVDAGNPLCSPGLAEDTSLTKMPPTLMICCDNDTFRDENLAFARRLMGLGVPVYARCFRRSGHGFTIQRCDEFSEAEQMILTALKTMM
jgi:acetyl esterase